MSSFLSRILGALARSKKASGTPSLPEPASALALPSSGKGEAAISTAEANVGVVSGAPAYLLSPSYCEGNRHNGRSALIVAPSKSAMQSGLANTRSVRLEWDRRTHKWENPLIGWTSSRDAMQAVVINRFGTVAEAQRFAERQGWDAKAAPAEGKESAGGSDACSDGKRPFYLRPKAYAENFKYSPGKLRVIPTK